MDLIASVREFTYLLYYLFGKGQSALLVVCSFCGCLIGLILNLVLDKYETKIGIKIPSLSAEFMCMRKL